MPARLPVSQRRTTVRAPVSATATKSSSFERAHPVGEREPVEDDLDGAVRVPAAAAARFGCSGRSRPSTARRRTSSRSPRTTPCRRRDRGVVAEHHLAPGDAVGDRLDRSGAGVDAEHPAVGVADQQSPVEVDLDAERPAAGLRDPVDLLPSWVIRKMLPSSVPVKTAPSSGPRVRPPRPRRRTRAPGSPGSSSADPSAPNESPPLVGAPMARTPRCRRSEEDRLHRRSSALRCTHPEHANPNTSRSGTSDENRVRQGATHVPSRHELRARDGASCPGPPRGHAASGDGTRFGLSGPAESSTPPEYDAATWCSTSAPGTEP